MFEDSTFESAGRIHTRSRRWMMAAFSFNTSILVALILIPLICPEALPRQAIAFLMDLPAPPTPQTQPKPIVQTARPLTETPNGTFTAPSKIPHTIYVASNPEPPIISSPSTWDPNSATPGGVPFGKPGATVVHLAVSAPVRVSSTVEAGLILRKTMPVYPVIAKAAGISGTVTLAATISKGGTIDNLHVTSGPAMLQQAALDAVKTWLYRPYLLDGQPVEVETTVNVIFTLGR